jgi:hypothetical protein
MYFLMKVKRTLLVRWNEKQKREEGREWNKKEE